MAFHAKYSWAVVALASAMAMAQAGTAAKPSNAGQPQPAPGTTAPNNMRMAPMAPSAGPSTKASSLPPGATVMVIKGMCSKPAAKTVAAKAAAAKSACETVVTKAQFEKIVDAVVPEAQRKTLPPAAYQQIAHQLAMIMSMSQKAESMGLASAPNVKEKIELSRDQVLAQALNERMLEDAKPTDAQVQKYYDQNPAAFAEATLQRLFIPAPAAKPPAPAEAAAGTDVANKFPAKQTPPSADEQKSAVEKFRQRAAAGEDFAKLQKEAFADQPNPQAAPSVDMGARRPGSLPQDQESVFSLNAGEVSQAFSNPAGYYIYKVVSKRQVPLTDAKDEITRKLQQQKFTDQRDSMMNSVDTKLNDDYFGPPPPMGAPGTGFPASRRPGTAGTPPPQPNQPH